MPDGPAVEEGKWVFLSEQERRGKQAINFSKAKEVKNDRKKGIVAVEEEKATR